LPLEAIVGGTPLENALRLTRVLGGRTREADSSVVALNAGALLMTAGRADDLRTGVAMALDAMASSRAKDRLDQFIEASRG
jgi:anthranilate phosphoribosyltransferase